MSLYLETSMRKVEAARRRQAVEDLRSMNEDLKRRVASPDLVLLDLEMPVKDGFAALAEIRHHPRFSRVPVMAVTAKAMLLDHDRILAAGFDSYVTKPIDIINLRARVNELLNPFPKENHHERRR
jgi:CheY-like chemotaxis protein